MHGVATEITFEYWSCLNMCLGFCLKCPMSGDVMHDPVHAPDGYVYERSHIMSWLQSRTTSPLTGETMEKTLIPARTIKLAIDQLQNDATLMPYIKAVERPPSCAKPCAKVTQTMHVPKNIIALVIGSRGETVRKIEEATETKITIDQRVDPCLLNFAGPEAGIASARASVTNIVVSARPRHRIIVDR
jgi:hypothetical protein